MSSPRFSIFVFVCFAGMLATALAGGDTGGPELEIVQERGFLTLIYTVQPDIITELQASSNLLEWSTAVPVDEIATQNPDGTTRIQAQVSPATVAPFFRLRRATPQQLTVAWDPAADPDVVGYIIRLRRRGEVALRRINAGNSTTATLVLPKDGGLYSFDVISYNAEGLESEPSNAIAILSNDDRGG
jgi:hypothetical protein